MACDSILPEQSKMKRSSEFSEAKSPKRCSTSGTKKDPFGGEDDSKKRESLSLSEISPVNHPSSSEIKKNTSGTYNNSLRVTSDELEFEIEKARLDIFHHFEIMKVQMINDDKVMAREMEIWTRGGLANIRGGKTPRNEFFLKSLIGNFEEIIGNIGLETQRDVNQVMDDIRKILVKLVNRIEQSFRPKPYMEVVRVTRRDIATYLWIGLWSIVAVLICIFPDYLLKVFESAVAYYQSTILIFFLFSVLYFYSPVFK